MLVCMQHISLMKSESIGKPMSKEMYSLYCSMAFAYQNYSFLNTLLGSPSCNFFLKVLGVKIKGHALLFPQRMYEYSYITVANNTIIDSSHITGHYAVYDDVTLGPCHISGLMHEGSYAANTYVSTNESDFWRASVGLAYKDLVNDSCTTDLSKTTFQK